MEDVQQREDHRGVALDKAGVTGLRYPIVVLDRTFTKQHTVATITMSVSVPQQFKGTHMSRFIEVLEEHRDDVNMWALPTIIGALRQRLDAESARIEMTFPYFLERAAPVTGSTGLMDYACTFIGESSQNGGDDFVLKVVVPVTSLCPCSKAISDYGAHNQRGHVTLEVRSAWTEDEPGFIWIEELIDIAEEAAACRLYPLLKRPDERHVTMQAYDNPVFVEDMVRNAAVALKADDRVRWFRVHAVNFESIHNHNAFAEVVWERPRL